MDPRKKSLKILMMNLEESRIKLLKESEDSRKSSQNDLRHTKTYQGGITQESLGKIMEFWRNTTKATKGIPGGSVREITEDLSEILSEIPLGISPEICFSAILK